MNHKKLLASAVAAATMALAGGTASAVVVNIDATSPSANPVSVYDNSCPTCTWVGAALTLGAGAYTVTPVNDSYQDALYTAANRFSAVDNPGQDGQRQRGWEWSLWLQIDGVLSPRHGYGGGMPTNSPGYQVDASTAFANAPAPFSLTLGPGSHTVNFLWMDDKFSDNQGGISVSVVPEPYAPAMALAGLGVIAFVVRRRRLRQ